MSTKILTSFFTARRLSSLLMTSMLVFCATKLFATIEGQYLRTTKLKQSTCKLYTDPMDKKEIVTIKPVPDQVGRIQVEDQTNWDRLPPNSSITGDKNMMSIAMGQVTSQSTLTLNVIPTLTSTSTFSGTLMANGDISGQIIIELAASLTIKPPELSHLSIPCKSVLDVTYKKQ